MALVELEEVKEYLAGQMIEVPDFVILMYLEVIESIELCMVGNKYPEAKQKLIMLTLLTLLVMLSSDARVTSRKAPNGAAQSFKIEDLGKRWKTLTGILGMLDPNGCTEAFIPPNPDGFGAGLWVSPGSQPGFCS